MPSKEKSLLTEFKPLELDLASRELHGEENLKEFIHEITSKPLQTHSVLRHAFKRELIF